MKPYPWYVSNVEMAQSNKETHELTAKAEWIAVCEFTKDNADKPYKLVRLPDNGEGARGYVVQNITGR
jgi:hypothetical protein